MIFRSTTIHRAMRIDLEPPAGERGFSARFFCEREFGAAGLATWSVQAKPVARRPGAMRPACSSARPGVARSGAA